MFKRSDYSPGDVINEYGNIYIKDAEDNKKNIITNCYRCGNIIEKRWDKLKNGATCNSCGWIISGEKRTRYHYEKGDIINRETGTTFINYTHVNKKGEKWAIVQCGQCGNIYETCLTKVRSGCLCKKCRQNKIAKASRRHYEGDILTSKKGLKYKILKIFYNYSPTTYEFILLDDSLNEVGSPFIAQLSHVMNNSSAGGGVSIAEIVFEKSLKNLGYSYQPQKTFPVLLSEKGNKLRFDFCIYLNGHKNSDRLLLIELDGPQHFFPVEVFGGEESFNKLKLHDSLKDSFVNSSENIFLVRIPYTDFKLIDDNFVKDIVEKYNYKHNIGGEDHR